MQHGTATSYGSRDLIEAGPFVRTPAAGLDRLPAVPRRLPARLRRRATVTVPPA